MKKQRPEREPNMKREKGEETIQSTIGIKRHEKGYLAAKRHAY